MTDRRRLIVQHVNLGPGFERFPMLCLEPRIPEITDEMTAAYRRAVTQARGRFAGDVEQHTRLWCTCLKGHPLDTPLFQNTSGAAEYLGTFDKHDLYFDPQTGLGIPTVIARFGPAPGDYKSGLAGATDDPHLAEAKARAYNAGLI